jgi:hypothetical protein
MARPATKCPRCSGPTRVTSKHWANCVNPKCLMRRILRARYQYSPAPVKETANMSNDAASRLETCQK